MHTVKAQRLYLWSTPFQVDIFSTPLPQGDVAGPAARKQSDHISFSSRKQKEGTGSKANYKNLSHILRLARLHLLTVL